MSNATKYDVYTLDGAFQGQRARKDTAIKLGDDLGEPFKVLSSKTGATVHLQMFGDDAAPETTEAPAPAEKKEPTVAEKTTAPKTSKAKAKKAAAPAPAEEATTEERTGTELEFQGLGKYYARAAGLHGAEKIGAVYGVEAELKGTTLTLFGADEDVETVSEHLLALWPAAKLAHREYRKNDATYSSIDKSRKNKEANAQRWDLEVRWFQAFMDGAADALAETPRKKGGAYKDGVNAVLDPAPVADAGDDVI